MNYPKHLLRLIQVLKKLPSVGSRSAERFALQMLKWPQEQIEEMAQTIADVPNRIVFCNECGGYLDVDVECSFCFQGQRQQHTLCVVAYPKDIYSIEQTKEYRGLYHVLGGMLSPLDGINADALRIDKLLERLRTHAIKEVIIALDSTLEGDTTALYLKQQMEQLPLSICRIAFGVPMGSSLDYIDGGTLARAMQGRIRF